MKKKAVVAMVLIFVTTFSGCGGNSSEPDSLAENNSIIEEAAEDTVLTDIEKTELTEETPESKEAVVDDTNELSDEEIATAKEIAAGYYSGTVFEVNSMEFIESEVNPRAEGECNFMVNVSIGGVVQEVDRMISLNKVNGLWEVVSEGY